MTSSSSSNDFKRYSIGSTTDGLKTDADGSITIYIQHNNPGPERHEGDLTVLEGSALQLDLKGYEGDRVVPQVVRFDFEQDGTLRHRVWSLKGTERTLMLDVHHKELEPKND